MEPHNNNISMYLQPNWNEQQVTLIQITINNKQSSSKVYESKIASNYLDFKLRNLTERSKEETLCKLSSTKTRTQHEKPIERILVDRVEGGEKGGEGEREGNPKITRSP